MDEENLNEYENDRKIIKRIEQESKKEYFNNGWICPRCNNAHIFTVNYEIRNTKLCDCDGTTVQRIYNWNDYDKRIPTGKLPEFEIPQDIKDEIENLKKTGIPRCLKCKRNYRNAYDNVLKSVSPYLWEETCDCNNKNLHLGFLTMRQSGKSNLMLDNTHVKLGRRAKLEEVPLSYAQYKELDEKFFELTNAFHNMEIMMQALKDKFERD